MNDDEEERIECPFCHETVIEDEFLVCPECDDRDGTHTNICLYCYEGGCPVCWRHL